MLRQLTKEYMRLVRRGCMPPGNNAANREHRNGAAVNRGARQRWGRIASGFPSVSAVLTSQAIHLARIVRCGGRTEASPDRLFLISTLLPAFAKIGPRLLWVGVRRYTFPYYALLEREGAECWTLDIDPKAARWGRRKRHFTGDLLEDDALPPGATFSGILCNGVFGYGIDDETSQARAMRRLAALLEPGAWLLLGWNTHNCRDPMALTRHAPLVHQGLTNLRPRTEIRGTTHVFDLLQRM